MGDAFQFWHHSLFALIFYLQFPIAELAAIAELHLHSDVHFDGADGATLIHEQERCLQRFLPQQKCFNQQQSCSLSGTTGLVCCGCVRSLSAGAHPIPHLQKYLDAGNLALS